jgi:hypothetical protein
MMLPGRQIEWTALKDKDQSSKSHNSDLALRTFGPFVDDQANK